MSAPIEALGLVPNLSRQPGEWFDIRPHGTEARARRERRKSGKPCPECLRAENAARAYRRTQRAAGAPANVTSAADHRSIPVLTPADSELSRAQLPAGASSPRTGGPAR